jgi:hypothetical protein
VACPSRFILHATFVSKWEVGARGVLYEWVLTERSHDHAISRHVVEKVKRCHVALSRLSYQSMQCAALLYILLVELANFLNHTHVLLVVCTWAQDERLADLHMAQWTVGCYSAYKGVAGWMHDTVGTVPAADT